MSDQTYRLAAPPRSAQPPEWTEALKAQVYVLHALILHDIKSRYFGNGLGYIFMVVWPMCHIVILMGIFIFRGQPAPYGDSRLLYVATSVLPFIAWNYISRFTLLGVTFNRSFLQYPIVRPLDIMFARISLELVSCFIITVILLVTLALSDINIIPHHPDQAALGLLSAVLLGVGFAVFNGVIAMIFPLWAIAYVVVIILFWTTSGQAIDPEKLPSVIGDLFAWNPLLHCVEWIRSGYYDDIPHRLLDKEYVLSLGFGSLTIGLLMERALRRYFT